MNPGMPIAHGALRPWTLLAGACLTALACTAGAAATEPASGASAPYFEPGRAADLDLSNEAIEPLRLEARLGDADAALALTARLVQRYAQGQATNDLYEATVWLDRYGNSERFADSGVLTRMQELGCGHPVLRLHPLCEVVR